MSAREAAAVRRGELLAAAADVVVARDNLRAAGRGYHLALVTAAGRGVSVSDLAAALGTSPHYVANTLHNHREGRCGCGAAS